MKTKRELDVSFTEGESESLGKFEAI